MAHNGNQDKGRRLINLHEAQIGNVLPDHFKEAYPKFITLLEKYYEFQDQNDPAELVNHLFETRDITETDLTLLDYIEDELLLGERYAEGFPDQRAAANFSSILFRSKGSKFAIEWFFRSFFNEDVEVQYPKNNVFNVGSSAIGPDSEKYITDNALYQTFSLLIRAGIPFSQWRDMFKLFAHPAGMYLGAEVLLEGVGEITVEGDAVADDFTTATYSLSALPGVGTREGLSVTVRITGTNSPEPEPLYWYITHGTTSDDDFDFDVPTAANPQYIEYTNPNTTYTLDIAKDLERDDAETFTFVLVNQYDRVLASLSTFTIQDDLPVYTVSSPSVTEGSDLVFTITLNDAFYDGETLNWALSSPLSSDSRIGTTSGTVAISGQTGTVTIPTSSSDVYQGATSGALVVSDTRFSPAVTASGTGTINDAAATYSIVVDPEFQTDNNTVNVNVTTTNVPNATNVYLAVTHIDTADADFSTQPPGQGATAREAISISSNSGSTTLTYANDTDTSNETYTVELWSAVSGGTKLDEFTATILGDGLTYSLSVDDTNLSEFSEDTATFTFTTNDADGTYYYFFETLTGTITSADFQSGEWKETGSRGTFTVTSGTGTFTLQALADGELEGNATFRGRVAKTNSSSAIASSPTVTLTDDSTATYAVSASDVTEGSSLAVTVTATNYDNENVSWSITGVTGGRITTTSGTLTSADFTAGVATLLLATTDDSVTTGDETGTFTVTGAVGGSTANDTFTISDPAVEPTYSISVANITEGDDLVVNIDAADQNGETVYIEVTGAGVTGRVTTEQITTTVSTNDPFNFTISTTTLSNTFQGDQTGTVTLGRGDYVSGTGTQLATDTFTMTDAALSGTISSTDGYTIDEDEGAYSWAVSGTNLDPAASYYWIITSTANPTVFATTDMTANSGQAVIPLADTTNISVGYKSTNSNVGGTVISKTSGSVTMSTNLTATISSGTDILFYDADLDNKFSVPSGPVTITANTGSWSLSVSADTTQDDFSGEMELYQGWGTTLVDDQAFTVTDLTPSAPTITAPTNESAINDDTPTLTLSGAPATHTKTDWQVATDASFTTIHEESLGDTVNKTSYTVTSALSNGTTYYVRARTFTNNVPSAYSATVEFEYWDIALVTMGNIAETDTGQYLQQALLQYEPDGSITLGNGVGGGSNAWLNDLSNPTIDDAQYEGVIISVTGSGLGSFTSGLETDGVTYTTMNGQTLSLAGTLDDGQTDTRVVTVRIREIANPSTNVDTHEVTLKIIGSGTEV